MRAEITQEQLRGFAQDAFLEIDSYRIIGEAVGMDRQSVRRLSDAYCYGVVEAEDNKEACKSFVDMVASGDSIRLAAECAGIPADCGAWLWRLLCPPDRFRHCACGAELSSDRVDCTVCSGCRADEARRYREVRSVPSSVQPNVLMSNPEHVQFVEESLREGRSVLFIARKLGLSAPSARDYAKAAHWHMDKSLVPVLSRAVDRWRGQEKIEAIAEALGLRADVLCAYFVMYAGAEGRKCATDGCNREVVGRHAVYCKSCVQARKCECGKRKWRENSNILHSVRAAVVKAVVCAEKPAQDNALPTVVNSELIPYNFASLLRTAQEEAQRNAMLYVHTADNQYRLDALKFLGEVRAYTAMLEQRPIDKDTVQQQVYVSA